jgi:uncharacterized membrane protein (DUF106 family)
MLDLVNTITVPVGDAVFAALGVFSPGVGLWIISAVAGVIMLLIWRYTSNQSAIADVRRQISAHLLATRLFKDNLAVTFRAQRQILWQALRLMGHSLRPMAVMLVPFVLIMVQIGLRYEFRPFSPGERIRVKATMRSPEATQGVGARLALPEGITADRNDPCRAPALRTVDWRLAASKPGDWMLVFGEGADQVRMPLRVGGGFVRLSRFRGGAFSDRLLYSAEPSIDPASAFESIEVYYPARSTPVFGLDVHWLITFFVLSIVFALLAKPVLKVHI